MDLTTLLGIILSLVAVLVGMILKGADFHSLMNPAAFLIIIVGTVSAVMIAFPMKDLKKVPKLFKMVFTNKKTGMAPSEMVETFVGWATRVRKEGILSIESEVKQHEDDFIKRWLSLAIDGMSAHELREGMEAEIGAMEDRHSKGSLIFTQAGTYAPTLGVLGAVVGLMAALSNLNDIEKLGHGVVGAFVATLLGIYTGYVIWHPFSNKLKQKSAEEVLKKTIMMECIILIQEGNYPKMVENKILLYLMAKDREQISQMKESKK